MDTKKVQSHFEELTRHEASQIEGGSFLGFLAVCFFVSVAVAFIATCGNQKAEEY